LFRKKKNTAELSESEIIALAKEDAHYFGQLYQKYFDVIFRFIFKRLGGNIQKYEDRGLSFSSWLFRIAQNEVNMFFRKQKNAYSVEIEERKLNGLFDEAQITGYMSVDDQEQLVQLLNELEQEQLDLVELRFFQEMSFKEIADIYNITEANAKMRVYRILEKLNKKWSEKK
jgi:RNA polymerase sigma-70 factor (ECF subfamily)